MADRAFHHDNWEWTVSTDVYAHVCIQILVLLLVLVRLEFYLNLTHTALVM